MDRGGRRADVMADFFQATHTLTVPTRGKGFVEITANLCRWLKAARRGWFPHGVRLPHLGVAHDLGECRSERQG